MVFEIIVAVSVIVFFGHLLDYKVLKERHFYTQKWDLNICCGLTDGGGLNADIIERDVPNFVLIKDIYNLPFKDKQFENTICSHTLEHVDDPERFFNELRRVSKNVTVLVPPIWDMAAFTWMLEHKWQFFTLNSRHVNRLPQRLKLPYDSVHNVFGQRVK